MRTQCDVLVIGGGMAGIRASIQAHDCGAKTVLVSKKKQGYGGSSFFPNSLPWGIMTAGQEPDAEEVFYKEIIEASCGCINTRLVELMARDSNARYEDLCRYGVRFTRLSETKRVPCFGRKPRGAQLNDMHNLRDSLNTELATRDIKPVDHVTILELLVKDQRCFGAIGVDEYGKQIVFEAKAVILATGGAEDLWKYNVVTPDVAGDGYAMAIRNCARLTNMEFVQFIPATINTPAPFNFHTLSLGSIPRVYNAKKESFLKDYLPAGISAEACLQVRATHGPFSNEDASRYFDIAISCESDDENIGAEIEYGPAYYEGDKYLSWKAFLASKGIDTKKINLRLYPHCQGFNGGIVIDENGRTDIEDLYACGECAGGPHGANRVGGNAILATQVFGKIAGENAALRALKNKRTMHIDHAGVLQKQYDTGSVSKLKPDEIMASIKEILYRNAMIIRDASHLEAAINQVRQMRQSFNPYEGIVKGVNVHLNTKASNALLTAQAILHAMAERKESRGSHYRMDYPVKSDSFNEMNMIKMRDLQNSI